MSVVEPQGVRIMGRLGIRQLCVLVLACGVYFGGLSHAFSARLRPGGPDLDAAFAREAVVAWLLLAGVYALWRQATPLALHVLCAALALALVLGNPDVTDPLGPACWAASLLSFPFSLAFLALSSALGRRIDPLADRLARRPAR